MTPVRNVPADTDRQEVGERPISPPQRVAASRLGMVATARCHATDAGVEILEDGGNAVDAAVASALALSVCEPAASGLGGQTMMLIFDAPSGRKIALDGSSRAPHRVPPGGQTTEEMRFGHRASTVPSTPAVLAYALDRYGTLPWARVLEPARALAEHGWQMTELQHYLAHRDFERLRNSTAAPLLLHEGQAVYPAGAHFRQPALASTLERLSIAGVRDFYLGEIAEAIVADMEANDGLIRQDDLAQIPWPIERRPLATWFGDGRVFTFGPPGAGRVLIEMLNVLNRFPPQRRDPDTPGGAVLLAEVIRQAQFDRHDRPFDPHFYPQASGRRMVSRDYARELAAALRHRIDSSGETTHLSVMDARGSVVALTQSIERVFGGFAASDKLGFLYNNYLSAFEYEDISHPYYLRPNAVPWASVAPTIVFRGRHARLALGSPGSERIVSAIAQVLLRLHDHTPFEAVDAPRLHTSLEGRVSLEAARIRDDIPRALEEHGLRIDVRDPYSFYMGCVQLVLREGDEFIGVADPRRDGSAAGPQGSAT